MPLTLWTYLAAINLFTFAAFALDKAAAESNRPRTPELTLLSLAFIGGSLGALTAQQVLRHKTRKQPFGGILIAVAALHVVGAILYIAG
ncbi:MAG: DUF1294 domain-containing protein [Alphaproteobacteria bacterium]|nr:DUF1294 domain-containing protein [Alphaproteobacteria bacterium]